MTEATVTRAQEMIVGLGRHWGLLLAFGIVNLVIGVIAVFWPHVTLVAIAVLFGIELVVAGIFRFVAALATDEESTERRVLLAVLGVLSFIVGLYAVRHLLVTLGALALLLGIFWIVNGAIEIFMGFSGRSGAGGRVWELLSGVLSVVAGIIVLMYPDLSLLALAIVLGIWLIVYGIIEIVAAFRLRGLATRVAGGPLPAT